MRRRSHPRPLRTILLGASAVALLAGCEAGQFGLSGRDAEWQRRGPFGVVSASPERAVVSARGQPVAVEPPPGFCVAEDSIETSDRSAFVLIGDCVLQNGAGTMPGADGGLELPPGMPGITTVSISGDPGFGPSGVSAEDLSELESYLATPAGRALLGRGGDGSQVSVVETRREGNILYVLVEDRSAQAVPLLAPRFWRAFTVLNDRLTIVTVSGFRDLPMDENEMLRHVGDQVRQLQLANAMPVEDPPIQVAEAPRRPPPAETGSGDEGAEPAELALGETSAEPTAPVDQAWAEAALAEATGEDFGVPAGDAGPDEEWLALATEAAGQPEPTGAAGGPDPVDGWGEAAAYKEVAESAGWPTGEGLARPAPQPMAVASTGAPASWPMPLARPDEQAPLPAAPSEEASDEAARAVADMPLPIPRLADPSDRAAETPPAGATVPLPPKRVRR